MLSHPDPAWHGSEGGNKPNPVRVAPLRKRRVAAIPLRRGLRHGSSSLPGFGVAARGAVPAWRAATRPFGARNPIWPCTGWGLPSRPVARPLVRSYRTFSPLPATGREAPRHRRCAFCCAVRPLRALALPGILPCGVRTFLPREYTEAHPGGGCIAILRSRACQSTCASAVKFD